MIRAFGLRPTINNLYGMAEEIERRIHIYPGGPTGAEAVIRELQRRASEIRRR